MCRIDSESGVKRVHQVLGLNWEIGYFRSGRIRRSQYPAAGNAAAGEYGRPGFAVMVTTGPVVDIRSASELPHSDHQRVPANLTDLTSIIASATAVLKHVNAPPPPPTR